jgi:hypothetical protein
MLNNSRNFCVLYSIVKRLSDEKIILMPLLRELKKRFFNNVKNNDEGRKVNSIFQSKYNRHQNNVFIIKKL